MICSGFSQTRRGLSCGGLTALNCSGKVFRLGGKGPNVKSEAEINEDGPRNGPRNGPTPQNDCAQHCQPGRRPVVRGQSPSGPLRGSLSSRTASSRQLPEPPGLWLKP
eukprot:1186548-Prorocentrum_minimum.AAC.2